MLKRIINLFKRREDKYYFYDFKTKKKILLKIDEKKVYDLKTGKKYGFVANSDGKRYHVFVKRDVFELFN